MDTYKKGDVVVLNSGGYAMTINKVFNGNEFQAVWHSKDGILQVLRVHTSEITLCTSDQEAKSHTKKAESFPGGFKLI